MVSKRLTLLLLCSVFIAATAFVLWPRKAYKPQIYDCFLFFNELELLEMRLSEMYDQVDKFVIVEASETFRGKPKPFFFEENRALFEKFSPKIIHIKLTDHLKTDDPWERERFQRQQVFQGLKQCHDKDLILLSDVDEIVRREAIPEIERLISSKQAEAVVCIQKMYHGFLNRYQSEWPGTVATRYKHAQRMTAKWMRRLRNQKPRVLHKAKISAISALQNAGWHFNSMGGVQRHITKLESFSHAECESRKYNMEAYMKEAVYSLPLVDIDSTFPRYVQEKRAYLESIGFIDQKN